jgi:polar amino acid transport system permease protein
MFSLAFALGILPKLAAAAVTTVWITFCAFLLSLVLGVPLLLLRRARSRIVAHGTTAFVDFVRCTPILVQLYFFYFALPGFGLRLSPIATGLLAFSLHYGCYMSEVYRAGLEAVPRGQWDASTSLSFTRLQAFRWIVFPQAVQSIIPAAGNFSSITASRWRRPAWFACWRNASGAGGRRNCADV